MKRHEAIGHHSSSYSKGATVLQDEHHYHGAFFSDSDILALQEKFLTSGFHYITVRNREAGRALVEMFLLSLNHYKNSACVTVGDTALAHDITDIYQELLLGGFVDEHGIAQALEDFFTDNFYHDFVWIEACEELCSASWFAAFEDTLTVLQSALDIPIMVILYEE